MFIVGENFQIEIFEYMTTVVTFLQNLEKFTNVLKNYVNSPESVYIQFSKFYCAIKYHYFRFSTTPKYISKNL